MNSQVDLLKEESRILAQIHLCMNEQGAVTGLQDFFNFVNFEREGFSKMSEFKRILIHDYQVTDYRDVQYVSEAEVGILAQRYRVPHSSVHKQKAFIYQFIQEMAYQHLGINLEN